MKHIDHDVGAPAMYHCSTGHSIPAADFERLSEIVTLDGGARVRVCIEHGAPVWVVFPDGTEYGRGAQPAADAAS